MIRKLIFGGFREWNSAYAQETREVTLPLTWFKTRRVVYKGRNENPGYYTIFGDQDRG